SLSFTSRSASPGNGTAPSLTSSTTRSETSAPMTSWPLLANWTASGRPILPRATTQIFMRVCFSLFQPAPEPGHDHTRTDPGDVYHELTSVVLRQGCPVEPLRAHVQRAPWPDELRCPHRCVAVRADRIRRRPFHRRRSRCQRSSRRPDVVAAACP